MQTYLCSLADARREIKAASTSDDAYVLSLIPMLSQRFVKMTGREFEPRLETRQIEIVPFRIRSGSGLFDTETTFLELKAVLLNGEALALTTDVVPYPLWEPRPKRRLLLMDHTRSWYRSADQGVATVTVTAWWGYRSRYETEGWVSSRDSVQDTGGMTTLATALRVTDADGLDGDGLTPRFSPGHLLRIDDEMLRVQAVDTATNTLTVARGQRGTTAVIHAKDTDISVWRPEEDVQRAVARWVALAYQRRGVFETRTVTDVGTISAPADMPQEVKTTAQYYANL